MSRLKDMLERLYHDTVTDDGYCYRCQMMGGHDETCAMAEVEALLGIEWDEPPRAEEELIYLASPYSHPDPEVREERYKEACMAAAAMMRAGHLVYSPIVHSHPLTSYDLPTDWGYWQRLDGEMLARCDELWVLMLAGWVASDGVQAEIQLAEALGLPRRYVRPEALLDAEHPVGSDCAECEELQVRIAMARGGGRCKKPRYANGSPIDMSRVVGALEEVP